MAPFGENTSIEGLKNGKETVKTFKGLNGTIPNVSYNDLSHFVAIELISLNLVTLPSVPFFNVVSLDLSNNSLSDLPETFKSLNSLISFNLSRNSFAKLPSCFSLGFRKLRCLDLSHNLLKDFTVKGLQSLESLNLENNKLIAIPEWLLSPNYSPLKNLNLSKNPCLKNIIGTCFFEKFHLLHLMKRSISKTVETLTLSNCQLTVQNSLILMAFDSIKELNLSNNVESDVETSNCLLQAPPASMERMEMLTVLNLSCVKLSMLHDRISKFENLRVLDASGNFLSWLPSNFSELKNLEVCDLSWNKFEDLPEKIGNLCNLRVLRLSSNQLEILPESLGNLKNLEVLDLYANNLLQPPSALQNLNIVALDLENNFFDSNQFKLQNANYIDLKRNYRKNYQLDSRSDGFKVEDDFSVNNEIESSSQGSSSRSSSFENDCDYMNSCSWRDPSTEETWDEGISYEDCLDDEFDASVHCAENPIHLWQHTYGSRCYSTPLQVYMYRSMRCQSHNEYPVVIRADIPETRSACFMRNTWLTDDLCEFSPFVVHPNLILYEEEVRKLLLLPPSEGQFDDADA